MLLEGFYSKPITLRSTGVMQLHMQYFSKRVPSKVLNYKTAYEKLFGVIPDLSTLKVFGSLCFMSTHACNTIPSLIPEARNVFFLTTKKELKGMCS